VNNLKNISYGKFQANVTKGIRYYRATSLIPNTEYTISTHTVDTSGNINMTWVNPQQGLPKIKFLLPVYPISQAKTMLLLT
jgi:hypothetical protein